VNARQGLLLGTVALLAGAFKVLRKPGDPAILLSAVVEAIGEPPPPAQPVAHLRTRHASRSEAGGFGRWFLQLRGEFTVEGTAGGIRFKDAGRGFFETYVRQGTGP